MIIPLTNIKTKLAKEILKELQNKIPHITNYIWFTIIEGNYIEHGCIKETDKITTEVDVFCNKCKRHLGTKISYYTTGFMSKLLHHVDYCDGCV